MFKKLKEKLGIHRCNYADNGYIKCSIRLYRCTICGHKKWVDGRLDAN